MDNVRIVLIESCSIECDMLFFPSLILVNVLYIYMIASRKIIQHVSTNMLMFLIFIKINDSKCMGIQYDILFHYFILKERDLIYTDIQNSSILTF